jgi:hypothetical protein
MEIWTEEPNIGIPDAVPAAGIRVFPNPAGHRVNVAYPLSRTGILQVSLLNIMGQAVAGWSLPTGPTCLLSLEIPDLPAGIYTLILEDSGTRYSAKLVTGTR